MEEAQVYRILRGWWRSLVLSGCWLLFTIVIPPQIGVLELPWSNLAWVVLVMGLVLAVRAIRSAIVVSDLHVTVRKVWWTSSLLRTDVTDVIVMNSAMLKFDSCLGIERVTGKPLKVPFLSPGAIEEGLPRFRDDIVESRC